MARLLIDLSNETRRQIGILVARSGLIEMVIVGDDRGVTIPDLSGYRTGIPRLRGLRLIHTHLHGEPLTEEDMTDLALLRLDMIAALMADPKDHSEWIHYAHLLPDNPGKKVWEINPPVPLRKVEVDFLKWAQSLEDEFQKGQRVLTIKGVQERAILLSVGKGRRDVLEESMDELRELAQSSGVLVIDSIIQRPQHITHSTLIGEGKLKELLVICLQQGVDLIIFDQNLTPGQMASISDRTELRVIDRTQLILDIFSQRAHTREGKIQVELAQLKYLLPRLAKKTLALSRLTGGIGGRGPGETKLEIDRRRARERIHLLEKEIEKLGLRREQQRARRIKTGIPVVSIIGYTNAGKSTLFNLLTKSGFNVEDKLFATLDTATRRLRLSAPFPAGRLSQEVVITDTVGFITDLPRDLMAAFGPTFDELRDSDLLIHLVDISSHRFQDHIEAVEEILSELGLDQLPRVLVFNKKDRLDPEKTETLCRKYGTIAISALRPDDLGKFFFVLEKRLWEVRPFAEEPANEEDKLTKGVSFDISN